MRGSCFSSFCSKCSSPVPNQIGTSPYSWIPAGLGDAFAMEKVELYAAALAELLFPGRGVELSNAWRTRQVEYQWLRALSGHYEDFWQTTDDALVFASEMLKLEITAARCQHQRPTHRWRKG